MKIATGYFVLSVFICVAIVPYLFAQENSSDSLNRLLINSKNDTNKLELLNLLIEAITDDSVWMPYNHEMEQLAQQLINSKNKQVQQTALSYKALSLYNSGFYFYTHSDYEKALRNYFECLKIYESLNKQSKISETENEIGNVYSHMNDPVHEKEHFNKSVAALKGIGDSAAMIYPLNGLGVVFNNENNFSEALHYFKQSLHLSESIGDRRTEAVALSNIGGVYDKQNKIDSALIYYNKSLNLFNQLNDEEGLYSLQISIGNIYLKQKKFDKAGPLFQRSFQFAKSTNNISYIIGAVKYLSLYYAATGNFKEAYRNETLFKTLTDSLRNDKNRLALLNLQANYAYDKKEAALKAEQEKREAIAQQEIGKQKIIRNAVAAAAGILIVSGYFSLMFYRRRRESELQRKITEQRMHAINAQMNPHFIFNCMHTVQSLIAKKNLTEADNCLMRFAKLIRKVLDNSTQTTVSLEDELATLNDYVELEKMRLDYPLQYQVIIDAGINADDILIPPLLLQPVVENAIIHGLKAKQSGGKLTIAINQMADKLLVVITDNGPGRTAKTTPATTRKSYGIPLTQERLQYLSKGTRNDFMYSTDDVLDDEKNVAGTKVSLFIPIE